MEDLPFRAEYSASGRAKCRGCKLSIDKDTLRIARMVQSAFHDGKQPNWYHYKCLFMKHHPSAVDEIAGYENLRHTDQEIITKYINENTGIVMPTAKGKGKKRAAVSNNGVLKDFGVEYSASARAACQGCELKISKGIVRIKKVFHDTEIGMKFGGQAKWHHVECFAQLRSELGYFETGEVLPGFKSLSKDDQKLVKDALPAVNVSDIPIKKIKSEIKDEVDSAEDAALKKTIIKQNEEYFKYRDYIKTNLKKKDWIAILERNNQCYREDTPTEKLLDLTADIITFGALKCCETCSGQFMFNKNGYLCTGYVTGYTKCMNFVKAPARSVCKINGYISKQHDTLSGKLKVQERAVKSVAPSIAMCTEKIKKEEPIADGPKVKREKPPLYLMEFAVIGKLSQSNAQIKSELEKLGGKFSTKIHDKLVAVIANPEDVERMNIRMTEAKTLGIQVVTENFIEKVKNGNAIDYITKNSICDWGTDPTARIKQEEAKSKSKSIYTKSVPKSVKLKLKDGTAVDPDSGLEDVGHVYVNGNKKYFAVLGSTDIQSDKNSFYKLQLIEHNNRRNYYVFRAWGRIGTTIGGTKVDNFKDVDSAISYFEEKYIEKSGNLFGIGKFEKKPGCYAPIELDFGDDEKLKKLSKNNNIPSNLSQPVQDLVRLMFDVDLMKKCMLEFDLDMEKMPLGKLSQHQLQQAMKVLSEISGYISNGGSQTQFIDASNRFYTLIPHDFGVQRPPILDTNEEIKTKIEMIESLMELEIAYGLLKEETDDTEKNPIDMHYEQLNTSLQVIDKKTDEFKMLKKYVENTHAATHSNFKLVIEDVFKVVRKGEERRYKPFKKLENRRLLWHGSRLTNYVGILSHGLKIAPPEAPATGYMFGKGIYFADMVSKSANYCFTSSQNNMGLMLLCEVALGKMFECCNANYVTKLPKNTNSCKGCGKTYPDEKENVIRKDGVIIPCGKPVTNKSLQSSLLYNEFIVYDIAQVNVQYLFRMRFDYSN